MDEKLENVDDEEINATPIEVKVIETPKVVEKNYEGDEAEEYWEGMVTEEEIKEDFEAKDEK